MGFNGAYFGGAIGYTIGGYPGSIIGAIVGFTIGEMIGNSESQLIKKNMKIKDENPEDECYEEYEDECYDEYIYEAPDDYDLAGERKNVIGTICPYCKASVNIKGEGIWICPSCDTPFSYDRESGESKPVLIVVMFSIIAKMAKADGVISKQEISFITEVMDRLELDSEDKKRMINIFNKAKMDSKTIYYYADQYHKYFDEESCESIYGLLWDLAAADGKISKEEDNILFNITKHLGFSEFTYFSAHSSYEHFYSKKTGGDGSGNKQNYRGNGSDMEKYYKILGCSETDSNETIKRKYRQLVFKYHPDKILSLGLPEDFIQFANSKVQQINVAYETIRKYRRFS